MLSRLVTSGLHGRFTDFPADLLNGESRVNLACASSRSLLRRRDRSPRPPGTNPGQGAETVVNKAMERERWAIAIPADRCGPEGGGIPTSALQPALRYRAPFLLSVPPSLVQSRHDSETTGRQDHLGAVCGQGLERCTKGQNPPAFRMVATSSRKTAGKGTWRQCCIWIERSTRGVIPLDRSEREAKEKRERKKGCHMHSSRSARWLAGGVSFWIWSFLLGWAAQAVRFPAPAGTGNPPDLAK